MIGGLAGRSLGASRPNVYLLKAHMAPHTEAQHKHNRSEVKAHGTPAEKCIFAGGAAAVVTSGPTNLRQESAPGLDHLLDFSNESGVWQFRHSHKIA